MAMQVDIGLGRMADLGTDGLLDYLTLFLPPRFLGFAVGEIAFMEADIAAMADGVDAFRQRQVAMQGDGMEREQEFARIVSSSSSTRCVMASNFTSGSLKPICAFYPMPSTCRSMPPFCWISAS